MSIRTNNRAYIKRWMETCAPEFETSTELAEQAAGEFDLYEGLLSKIHFVNPPL